MTVIRATVVAISLTLAISVAHCAYAQGGPPLITDDPGTPGDGNWEIDTAFIMTRTRETKVIQGPHLDINYGWGDHVQLKYEGGWLATKDKDASWHDDMDNSLFGVKWRFADEETSGVAVSTYPQIQTGTLPGVAKNSVQARGTNAFFPLEFGKKFGAFEASADFGYELIEYEKDQWMAGAALGYALSERIELLGELRDSVDQNLRGNDALFNLGAQIVVTKNASLIFSAGRSFRHTPESPNLLLYAGIMLNF